MLSVSPGPRRVALLLDHIESDYQAESVTGAQLAAQMAGTQLLVVAGGWLGRPEQPEGSNFIFGRVLRANIDALVILGGSLSNFCGLDHFMKWVTQIQGVPTISIGLDVPELATIHANNEVGVREAVKHLIEKHGRRRIAYIRGVGAEADIRYEAYRSALQEHGVRFDRRLVAEGLLGRDDGMRAVAELFDKRRFTPNNLDALMCVNDDVARGALDALKQRSIAIPRHVAVIGFDNSVGARSTSPPLTTVDQRVREQAYLAVQQVLEALDEGRLPRSFVLDTALVPRGTCGCASFLHNDSQDIGSNPEIPNRTCELALLERRGAIVRHIATVGRGLLGVPPGWETRLVDALVHDVASRDSQQTVTEIEELTRGHVATGGDVTSCQDVLTELRRQALQCAASEPEARPHLEDLFQDTRLIIGRIGVDIERSRHDILNHRVRIIAKQCFALLDTGTLEAVAQQLKEHLPALGIQGWVISRFRDPRNPDDGLEVFSRRCPTATPGAERLPSMEQLGIEPGLDQEGTLVLEPLEMGTLPLGIAAWTWGATIPEHYEELREVLSVGLRADYALRSVRTG